MVKILHFHSKGHGINPELGKYNPVNLPGVAKKKKEKQKKVKEPDYIYTSTHRQKLKQVFIKAKKK